jgi:hypothetical protein
MDFPADIAALTRCRRMNRLRFVRDPECSSSSLLTLPLDRAHVEDLKGLFVLLAFI